MSHYLRLSRCTLAFVMLTTLAGCVTPSVDEQPPPNVSLAGVWELNPALSSDTDKTLAALQPKPRTGPGSGRGAGKGRDPGSGEAPAPAIINDPTTDLPPVDPTGADRNARPAYFNEQYERNQYRPPIDFQTNALLGGQWLKISQSDTEMVIANAAATRHFTPGQQSVVSVTSGVADQVSGWSGRKYVVSVRPQVGPKIEESYALSPDGRQLLVAISVGSEGRNQAIKVSRVYDRSSKDPALLQQTLQQSLPPTY
jgi:hypothetical protein